MSLTVSDIQSDLNRFVGDASTDRITAADRLEYITEAVIWLQENLKNDHGMKTYSLNYIDTVNYYLITTPLADLLDGADLRRRVGKNYISMTHKSPRELAEDVANSLTGDDSWAIERADSNVSLVINAIPQFRAVYIDPLNTVTNWTADTSTSDMSNIRLDQNNFYDGNGSLEFDVVVGQSVNRRATMTSTLISENLSTNENFGVFLIDANIPAQAAYVSSYTLYWGTDSSNYWTATVTTDINGNAFSNGWFVLAFDWINATKVGSPTSSAVTYFRLDMAFTSSLTSQVAFHYDTFRIANPEQLTFYYVSFYVGQDSGGNNLLKFAATTDVPYFSGKYDMYRKAVAHQAASIAFMDLRLKEEAALEAAAAEAALKRAFQIYPVSLTKEIKSFGVQGVNFARRQIGRSGGSSTQR